MNEVKPGSAQLPVAMTEDHPGGRLSSTLAIFDPMRCERCGHEYPEWMSSCSNCRTEFWCEWDPLWYKSRWTRFSLGRDPFARRLSNVAVGVVAVALLYVAAFLEYAAASDVQWRKYGFAALLGAYSIYEIQGFFHGRTTSIERVSHEPMPKNTNIRLVGLALDAVALALAVRLLIAVV